MKKSVHLIIVIVLGSYGMYSQVSSPVTAKDYFEVGLRFLRESSFADSLIAFEKSAELNGKQPATFANIGAASMGLRRYDKAEAGYRKAIELMPSEGRFYAELCMVLGLQKKHSAAIEACEQGVRLTPDSDQTHTARIKAFRAAGRNLQEIERLVDTATAQFRNSEALMAMAADFYLANQDFSGAAGLLEVLVSMRPQTAQYHGMLAEAYFRLERENESLASARTALRLDPQSSFGNYAMGLIFFELGQNEEAAESFQKASLVGAAASDARYYQALSELRRGNSRKAASLLKELSEQYPDKPDFALQYATVLSDLNQFNDAEIAYSKANALRPKNAFILSGLGMSFMMRGRHAEAIPNFEEALRLRPDIDNFKMFLTVSRSRQTVVASIPSLVREADDSPKDLKKNLSAARALAFAARFDEAEAYMNRIYALNPSDHMVYHMIGVTFSEMGRDDKALNAYLRSVEKGKYAGAYFALASMYGKNGDFEHASQAYLNGIEQKPDVPEHMGLYADLLREHGKRREALEIYKRSLALLPLNPPVLYSAGVLSAKLGDKTAAQGYLGTLKTIDPQLARKLERCIAIWLPN